MIRLLTAAAVSAGLAFAVPASAAADEQVIVVDAPDVQKLDTTVGGFRTSDVIGTEVYSNRWKLIGEVEDFTYSHGKLYALIDIDDGAIEQYVELTDDEVVVIPVEQLRVAARPD